MYVHALSIKRASDIKRVRSRAFRHAMQLHVIATNRHVLRLLKLTFPLAATHHTAKLSTAHSTLGPLLDGRAHAARFGSFGAMFQFAAAHCG